MLQPIPDWLFQQAFSISWCGSLLINYSVPLLYLLPVISSSCLFSSVSSLSWVEPFKTSPGFFTRFAVSTVKCYCSSFPQQKFAGGSRLCWLCFKTYLYCFSFLNVCQLCWSLQCCHFCLHFNEASREWVLQF